MTPADWNAMADIEASGAWVMGFAPHPRGPFTVRITRHEGTTARTLVGCGSTAAEALRRAVAKDREAA